MVTRKKRSERWAEELRARLYHYIYDDVTRPDGTVVPLTPARDVAPLMRLLRELESSDEAAPKVKSAVDEIEERRRRRQAR